MAHVLFLLLLLLYIRLSGGLELCILTIIIEDVCGGEAFSAPSSLLFRNAVEIMEVLSSKRHDDDFHTHDSAVMTKQPPP